MGKKKRKAYEIGWGLEFRRVIFRSWLDEGRTLQGQRRKVIHIDSNYSIPTEWSKGSQSGDGSYLADHEMAPKDGSKTDNPRELWSHEMEPNRGAAIAEEGDDGSKGSNGSKTQHLPRAKAKRRLSLSPGQSFSERYDPGVWKCGPTVNCWRWRSPMTSPPS